MEIKKTNVHIEQVKVIHTPKSEAFVNAETPAVSINQKEELYKAADSSTGDQTPFQNALDCMEWDVGLGYADGDENFFKEVIHHRELLNVECSDDNELVLAYKDG